MTRFAITAQELSRPDHLDVTPLILSLVMYMERKVHASPARLAQVLPRPVLLLHALNRLHGTVCNGGFNFYFEDYRAELLQEAIEGFELFSLFEQARVVRLAAERFDPDVYGCDVSPPVENGEPMPFKDLDDLYFGLAEPGYTTDRYIRAHTSDFVLDMTLEPSQD